MSDFQGLQARIDEGGTDDLAARELMADGIKDMVKTFKEYENVQGSSEEEEADFISGVAQKISACNTNPIKAGTVAMVHSLQSAAGKKMNGSRVLVLRRNPEQRWVVRVEFEENPNATKALKGENLTPIRPKPLSTSPHRGFAQMNDIENFPTKLCELLMYSKGNFEPSDIIFTGYGSMAFQRMGQENFLEFYATQMEQMGGVLGLGNLCREAEEPATEAVVFAFLEGGGDGMYIDVLIQTMHCTGEIIEGESGRAGFNCPLTQLTPDQETAPYVRTMKEGPVLILECVAKYSFAPAFWAALSYSEFYHLLIQRLLRWVAREAKKTFDGKGLGGKARKILSSMFPEISFKGPISVDAAEKILSESSTLLSDPSSIT
ncbi:hypothetical protein ACHAXR_002066, partial [Thalassiosira sp. AJA248-18]